jgi:hypothetical protein
MDTFGQEPFRSRFLNQYLLKTLPYLRFIALGILFVSALVLFYIVKRCCCPKKANNTNSTDSKKDSSGKTLSYKAKKIQ